MGDVLQFPWLGKPLPQDGGKALLARDELEFSNRRTDHFVFVDHEILRSLLTALGFLISTRWMPPDSRL